MPPCASFPSHSMDTGGAGTRLPPWTVNPAGEAVRSRSPASRGPFVSAPDPETLLTYCPRHHMVVSPRTRKWIAVPEDFVAELQRADLPVVLVERRCPRCYKLHETRPDPQ